MTESLRKFLAEVRRRPLWFLIRRLFDEARGFWRSIAVFLGRDVYACESADVENAVMGRVLDQEALESVLKCLRQTRAEELSRLLGNAERIADFEFEIYSRIHRLSRAIDWNRDFESGYDWPVRFHSRYRYADLIDLGQATDIKVPWELGRLQCLPTLALAYRVSGEERYVAVARQIFESWSRSNPVGYGIQWVVGMEVALRGISLVLSAELLAGTAALEELVDRHFVKVVTEHGRFLSRNVEYSDVNGNHHTSCLVGLLYLGVWLAGVREAAAWRARAARGLRREILLQTYPDGVCHEGSIPYHRLVAELFSHAHVLARRAEIDLGEDYGPRLERMLDFVAAYTKPTGRAPAWGDADDGRVVRFGVRPVDDHRHLLAWGAGAFDRPDLWKQSEGLCLDTALLFDASALERIRSYGHAAGETREGSESFEGGGFYILRHGASWCLVDCGDVGLRGRGHHGHNDALSIELALDGLDVLTDTGCASYTRSVADRVSCISARAHNVAIVDGLEPAAIAEGRIPHATRCETCRVRWEPEAGRFVGLHRGYLEVPDLGEYERCLELGGPPATLEIVDRIAGRGEHDLEWLFHFAERWFPVLEGRSRVRLRGGDESVEAVLRCHLSGARLTLGKKPWYPTYGARRERWFASVSVRCALPVEARFELSIARGEAS